MGEESDIRDRIGQDVRVGDVLWHDGEFFPVLSIDSRMPKWAIIDRPVGLACGIGIEAIRAIRCPRPGEPVPDFDGWRDMAMAMQSAGADLVMRTSRSPDCTWRQPKQEANSTAKFTDRQGSPLTIGDVVYVDNTTRKYTITGFGADLKADGYYNRVVIVSGCERANLDRVAKVPDEPERAKASAQSVSRNCMNCHFAYVQNESRNWLQCRRNPPGENGFVSVEPNMWCGEFKPCESRPA